MLSRLFQYARNIFPVQVTPFSKDSETEKSPLPARMVTTRQNRGSNSHAATDTSIALDSLASDISYPSSKKRRRPQPTGELASQTSQNSSVSVTSTRKRQKLPLREKDEPHFERHTHIAVEIPVRDITQDDTPMWMASEQRQSEEDKVSTKDTQSMSQVAKEDGRMDPGIRENHIAGITDKEAIGEAIPIPKVSGKTASKQARKTTVESKSKRDSESTTLEHSKIANISNMNKPKHKRFDSEEPEMEEFETNVKTGAEDDEDASSDDGAPEVVAKDAAQEKAVSTARSAANAIEQQDAVIRKKRKEHDEQLKKQAEATSKKRKHIDDGVGGHATSIALTDSVVETSRPDASSASMDKLKSLKPRNTKTKTKIPEFLPVQFLEDEEDSESGPTSLSQQTMVHKSKKTKFLDPISLKPKDRKKGSTIYRVMEAYGDELLAPKATKGARSVKEAWLNGQRGGRGNKKVARGGFFKK